jgi:multiple sugar transport system permease protein
MAAGTHTPNRGYRRWTPFWFLAPAVFTLLAVGIYPLLFALVTSFRRYNITRPRDGFPFVGFDNYVAVFNDSTFWNALLLTARFYLSALPVQIVLGLAIALLLHRPGLSMIRSVARVSLVVPLATTA